MSSCKYCGKSIPGERDGYCSGSCADAVLGFDIMLRKERTTRRVVEFDDAHHSPVAAHGEEPPIPDHAKASASGLIDALTEMARKDIRMPGIVLRITSGETQESMAMSIGVSPGRVAQLMSCARRITLHRNA